MNTALEPVVLLQGKDIFMDQNKRGLTYNAFMEN